MPRSARKLELANPHLTIKRDTDLLSLQLSLQPYEGLTLPPHYATEFHSWFLDQIRRMDYDLSTRLHDGQSEKPFTVTQLKGAIQTQGKTLRLAVDQTYHWSFSALSKPVCEWVRRWLESPPADIHLRSGSLKIVDWKFAHPPTTYAELLKVPISDSPTIALSFLTPTSFRRRGNHLPLPLPVNVFHSYLRRWNDFSNEAIDQEDFLDWVDEYAVILRHQIQSSKVMAGKAGSVTGFTGSVQFGLSSKAKDDIEYIQLWLALGQLAPYCGTGHKTTFGLGETCLGWQAQSEATLPSSIQDLLAQRINELTEIFIAQRKRAGGDRATTVAETWATILARRELGESLQTIAQDLEMPYETVKTYAKLARKSLVH